MQLLESTQHRFEQAYSLFFGLVICIREVDSRVQCFLFGAGLRCFGSRQSLIQFGFLQVFILQFLDATAQLHLCILKVIHHVLYLL
jgi:hypothetical protein